MEVQPVRGLTNQQGKHRDFVVNVRSHGGHVAAIAIVLEGVFNAASHCQVVDLSFTQSRPCDSVRTPSSRAEIHTNLKITWT